MALSTAETQSLYMACGLHAEGLTRYRYVFNAYSTTDIQSTSTDWSYATVKTVVDTRLAALSAAAIVKLQTLVVVFDVNLTSSFKKQAAGDGVILDDAEEFRLAVEAIRQIIGVVVEPVNWADNTNAGRQGSVVR